MHQLQLLLVCITCCLAFTAATGVTQLYVSPNGSDSNPGTQSQPLKTPHEAQKRVQALPRPLTAPVHIMLDPGTYYMPQPLELTGPLDSGSSKSTPIVWSSVDASNPATLSCGSPVPPSAWKANTKLPGHYYAGVTPTSWRVRTLRVGGDRAEWARTPNVDAAEPDATGYFTVESSHSPAASTFDVTLAQHSAVAAGPGSWSELQWRGALAFVFPIHSWINFWAPVQPLSSTSFRTQCGLCSNHSQDTNITPGNRFTFVGNYGSLDAPGEWWLNSTSPSHWVLHYIPTPAQLAAGFPNDATTAVLPHSDRVVSIDGASYVSFSNLVFADADYTYQGWQDGFNVLPSSRGSPADAAVRVSRAMGVTIAGCTFAALGGGGVVIGNQTHDVQVLNSTFHNVGQSGVMFVGNDTSQARGAVVAGNTLTGIGQVLASSGAIYLTSASFVIIEHNTITDCSRWGIHIRSNAHAASRFNLVQFNRIRNTGLRTRDFGGISLIDNGHTGDSGTTIQHNCVRNTVGTDTDDEGHLIRPFFSWGVYLDNWSSGYTVTGNVIVQAWAATVFIHGGHNNTIVNNVFANATEQAVINGSAPMHTFGQATIGTCGSLPLANNTFTHNVVMYSNPATRVVYDTGGGGVRSAAVLHQWLSQWDSNVYYASTGKQANATTVKDAFPSGSWETWQAPPYSFDATSALGDPGFVNAAAGDWRLRPGALATRVGFAPLNEFVLQC